MKDAAVVLYDVRGDAELDLLHLWLDPFAVRNHSYGMTYENSMSRLFKTTKGRECGDGGCSVLRMHVLSVGEPIAYETPAESIQYESATDLFRCRESVFRVYLPSSSDDDDVSEIVHRMCDEVFSSADEQCNISLVGRELWERNFTGAELRARAFNALIGSEIVRRRHLHRRGQHPIDKGGGVVTPSHVPVLLYDRVLSMTCLMEPHAIIGHRRDETSVLDALTRNKFSPEAFVHDVSAWKRLTFVLRLRRVKHGNDNSLSFVMTENDKRLLASNEKIVSAIGEAIRKNAKDDSLLALALIAWYECSVRQASVDKKLVEKGWTPIIREAHLNELRQRIGECHLLFLSRGGELVDDAMREEFQLTTTTAAAKTFDISLLATQLTAATALLTDAGICAPEISPRSTIVAPVKVPARFLMYGESEPPREMKKAFLRKIARLLSENDERVKNLFNAMKPEQREEHCFRIISSPEVADLLHPYTYRVVETGSALVMLDVLDLYTTHSALADASADFLRCARTRDEKRLGFAYPRHLLNCASSESDEEPRSCRLGETQNTWSLGATLFALVHDDDDDDNRSRDEQIRFVASVLAYNREHAESTRAIVDEDYRYHLNNNNNNNNFSREAPLMNTTFPRELSYERRIDERPLTRTEFVGTVSLPSTATTTTTTTRTTERRAGVNIPALIGMFTSLRLDSMEWSSGPTTMKGEPPFAYLPSSGTSALNYLFLSLSFFEFSYYLESCKKAIERELQTPVANAPLDMRDALVSIIYEKRRLRS